MVSSCIMTAFLNIRQCVALLKNAVPFFCGARILDNYHSIINYRGRCYSSVAIIRERKTRIACNCAFKRSLSGTLPFISAVPQQAAEFQTPAFPLDQMLRRFNDMCMDKRRMNFCSTHIMKWRAQWFECRDWQRLCIYVFWFLPTHPLFISISDGNQSTNTKMRFFRNTFRSEKEVDISRSKKNAFPRYQELRMA